MTSLCFFNEGEDDDVKVYVFLDGLRVLVVDDDPTCLLMSNKMLELCKYKGTYITYESFWIAYFFRLFAYFVKKNTSLKRINVRILQWGLWYKIACTCVTCVHVSLDYVICAMKFQVLFTYVHLNVFFNLKEVPLLCTQCYKQCNLWLTK